MNPKRSATKIRNPVQLFRKIFDVLSGPLPTEEKKRILRNKSWLTKHYLSLIYLATITIGLNIPTLSDQINTIPNSNELIQFEAKILKTQNRSPHFIAELPDGRLMVMEFPITITFGGKIESLAWNDRERAELIGCEAKIQGQTLALTFKSRFRVWDLECADKNIHIDFNKTREQHFHSRGFLPYALLIISIYHLLFILIYLRERRGNI